ncbi:MAG: ROK family protein [bacterium]
MANNNQIIGLDIGGTKCAVILANQTGSIISSTRIPTTTYPHTIESLFSEVEKFKPSCDTLFGVSCGDPQDSRRGIILSPPNLPGWDNVPITAMLEKRFGGKAYLMNDANAGALAEWRFGAGRGAESMVFITCGTGFGAGLILDNRLYEGATGAAGEIGHVRLEPDGPVGYGKAGSVEGFCSGGGIALLAQKIIRAEGLTSAFGGKPVDQITARDAGIAADAGDPLAIRIFSESGRYLGRALAVLVDILNPQRIILGSVFVRCRKHLEPSMHEALRKEGLAHAVNACRIVPAELGESIGDIAAVTVALYRAGKLS